MNSRRSCCANRLKKYLDTNHFSPKKDVKTEYAVGGLGGFIDILADGEAYELKVNQASSRGIPAVCLPRHG